MNTPMLEFYSGGQWQIVRSAVFATAGEWNDCSGWSNALLKQQ
ncbi:MAG TPA: hypothetical protein PKO16_05305 [Bacteroidia bacterium]|nr:hypothetical protein [Bacteroidia bacterium]